MTCFEVAAERDRRGIRGEMTARGRGLAAQQPVGPPRWKLATLSWFGVFPVVTEMLALAERGLTGCRWWRAPSRSPVWSCLPWCSSSCRRSPGHSAPGCNVSPPDGSRG
jgi:hypothetical protein